MPKGQKRKEKGQKRHRADKGKQPLMKKRKSNSEEITNITQSSESTSSANSPSFDVFDSTVSAAISKIVLPTLDARSAQHSPQSLDRPETNTTAATESDSFVQQTAKDTVTNLLQGESQEVIFPNDVAPEYSTSITTKHSYFDPLLSLVSPAIREKILKREFFDLASLLPKNKILKQGKETPVLGITQGPDSVLQLTTKQPPVQITSFTMWLSAFSKYAFFRCRNFSNEAQGLFRHQLQVTELHQKYPTTKAWLDYDTIGLTPLRLLGGSCYLN